MSNKKAAVVTGAARGLGAEVAKTLAKTGWDLLLVDICQDDPDIPYALANQSDLADTLAACRALAGNDTDIETAQADVRNQAQLDQALALARDRFGGLDAAIAAAGVIAGGVPGWETRDEVWHAMLEVNLTGVWRLARAAVPALLSRPEPRQGRFIAISSVAGLRGFPSLAAYSAAKHGLIGFIRSIAAELGSSGVTANVVCPGSMDTAMLAATADIYGLPDVHEFANYHRYKRLLEAGEVARAVAWLSSGDSSGMTGSVLTVDAGMTSS